jgi:hypothetical protein
MARHVSLPQHNLTFGRSTRLRASLSPRIQAPLPPQVMEEHLVQQVNDPEVFCAKEDDNAGWGNVSRNLNDVPCARWAACSRLFWRTTRCNKAQ